MVLITRTDFTDARFAKMLIRRKKIEMIMKKCIIRRSLFSAEINRINQHKQVHLILGNSFSEIINYVYILIIYDLRYLN